MMLEIIDLMTAEQVKEWERLTEGRDVFDYFDASDLVNILTDKPPRINPIGAYPQKVNSILRKLKHPEITGPILSKISNFSIAQENNLTPWAVSLWFLAFKYGYDTVEEILDRVNTENFKLYEIEDFVKIVYHYDEMKHHPLKWMVEVL